MILLDTNVVSEAMKPVPDDAVRGWLDEQAAETLYLSSVTIAELMYYEAFGFCERGRGHELLASGRTSLGGDIVVNPSGGLLSRGHPVGATGIAQAVEIVRQLRGDVGAHQVEGAKAGLSHATGGGVAGYDHGACSIHIFTR